MVLRFAVSSLLVLHFAPAALGFPGAPACPDDSKKEVYTLPYARVDDSPCSCHTLLTCQNLDKKTTRVTVQFFSTVDPALQSGNNAARTLLPGHAGQFGTGADPLNIKVGPASAGIAGGNLTGRVCAASSRIACDAFLSCACPTGPVFAPLKIILKKQKGD